MVVWRIVQAHGGAIAVDSRVGEGTTISIALPLDSRPARLLPGRAITPIHLPHEQSAPESEGPGFKTTVGVVIFPDIGIGQKFQVYGRRRRSSFLGRVATVTLRKPA